MQFGYIDRFLHFVFARYISTNMHAGWAQCLDGRFPSSAGEIHDHNHGAERRQSARRRVAKAGGTARYQRRNVFYFHEIFFR